MDKKEVSMRVVRSFVRRGGRLTPAQSRGMTEGWPVYGVDYPCGTTDFKALFGREAKLVLEIGFGMGHAFLEQVQAHPEADFIGIEVHESGVGHVLAEALSSGIKNLRVFKTDAISVLESVMLPNSLDKLQLFFPDPWHKKRHHKRRIVNERFLGLVANVLKPSGVLHMATDWVPYAEVMREKIAADSRFKLVDESEVSAGFPRMTTRFERRGVKLGHEVNDISANLA